MVKGADPVDVSVSVCVVGLPTDTLPKARLLALIFSLGIPASSCSANVLDELPALAVSVAVWLLVTPVMVAE
jgi:hypothetical protein